MNRRQTRNNLVLSYHLLRGTGCADFITSASEKQERASGDYPPLNFTAETL